MRAIFTVVISVFLMFWPTAAHGQTMPEALQGFENQSGFFKIYVNKKTNKIKALIPVTSDERFQVIYTRRLRAGLGSNPVGLDRGWGDRGVVISFERYGDKLVIKQENLTYRANPDNLLEARAVDESFADSFLASLEIELEIGREALVDMTDFLTGDALSIVQHLKDRGQGSFTVAKDRSFVDTDNAFAFPDNVEIDSFLTLTSKDAGSEVATTAANGNVATLIQHHSFVRLPEEGFTPRISDPRMGAIETIYADYSVPLDKPIAKRLAIRHRLQKDDNGKTIDPIVFYIDSGAPEPVRSALVEGALWWKDAFAAAGFPDGYEVKLLPEDVHPLDVRYNVVQWVHRQTRGWSYGGGVVDPRTGELLKGHVNLGSLRVRQDRMIFEGLAGTEKTGTGSDDDPIELALDRIRQLSAHEIGHSLGFAHNFAASSYGKGSVMDYPAPDVRVSDGKLDFTHSYGVGIGGWDKFAAKMLYGELSPEETKAAYNDAAEKGLIFVADSEGRGIGTGHPQGAIWDNGTDAVETLKETMAVRRIALDSFDESRIHEGQPFSDLSKVIVPIYLYHRYQTAAAGKVLGGVTFDYGVAGATKPGTQIVPAGKQKDALDAILKTIEPSELDLPNKVLELFSPSLSSWTFIDSDRELFKRTAYPAFDLTSAAETAAGLTFDVLLNPQRAARMIEFKRRDSRNLSFSELLETTKRRVMSQRPTGRQATISQAIQSRFVFGLMDLVGNDSVTSTVKSQAHSVLVQLNQEMARKSGAHAGFLRSELERFLNRPAATQTAVSDEERLPPGSPIGQNSSQYETCWHCD